MANLFQLFANMLQRTVINSVASANYTILDNDGYTEIQVTTGASDRIINLPTLADNQKRKIVVRKMDSGVGKVIVTPEGAELINDWNATVEITEQYGWWDFVAVSGKWVTRTDGWSTVYKVETSADDATPSLTGAWCDVAGMSIDMTGKRGTFLLSAQGLHYAADTSLPSYLTMSFGLGKTSGNNTADIFRTPSMNLTVIANTLTGFRVDRQIKDIKYNITSDITIYMKVYCTSDEMNITTHQLQSTDTNSAYIQARRIR
jgi:hypothetical protein